MSVITGIA